MADFLLTVGVDVGLSYTEMQNDITALVSKINSDPQKIKIQFDIDKATTDKLKSQLDSIYKSMSSINHGGSSLSGTTSMNRVTQETRAANAQISDMASRLSAVNAALKEIQVTNNSITSTYKSIKNALGGEAATGQSAAELDVIKTKYLELQAAVERLRTSKSAATQEDINNIYQLQAELQTLMNTTQRRITAEQEAARVSQEAARAEEEAARSAAKAEAERAAQVAANERLNKQYFTTISQLENALRSYTAAENSKNATSREAYSAIKTTTDTLKTNYAAYKDGTISIEKFRRMVAEASTTLTSSTTAIKTNGDATKTLSERMGGLASKFGSWLTVSQAIMYSIRAIRQMITTSIELDDAMTQMQIVTKASAAQMNEFADSAAAAAQRVGSSISDFVDSATTYARLGYNMDESSQLAEFTAMLQNVGDIEVSDAQDAITSIVKAFDIDTDEIESVMDKLVTTGNNFPISVAQIAEGMTNASSALSAAGNTFEESVALLTAANTTIQDAAKSSTGLRTIAARIRNTKTELDDLGEVMTEASYEELVSMLTDFNVALTDVNGEYRSTYDIMADIAKQWDNMTSMEQAALATAMSGTRQQAVFFSIIEQFQEASGAMDAMANSAGALQDAYDIYLESTTAHINQFKAAFQELSADVFQSDFLQFFIDLGAGALSLVDGIFKIINAVGGMNTVLVATAGIIATLKADSLVTLVTVTLPGAIKKLASTFTSFISIFARIPTVWKSFNSGTALAVQGSSRFSTALKALGISASTAQIAIGALTAVITIAIAIYSRWKQSQEEARQAALDAGNAAREEASNIKELYDAYRQASDAYNNNTGTKENLTSATDSLLDALGIEETQLQRLADEYGNLDNVINHVTTSALKEQLAEMVSGYQAAKDELLSITKDGWVSSFGMMDWTEDTQDFGLRVGKILEDAGLLEQNNYNLGGTVLLGDGDTLEGVIAMYDKLIAMRDALVDSDLTTEELSSSDLYKTINDKLNAFETEYEVVLNYINEINSLTTQLEYTDYIDANGIPETRAEFEALQQALLDTAGENKRFVGTETQIHDSIVNTLADIPELSQFFNTYSSAVDDAANAADEAKSAFSFGDLMAEEGDGSFSEQIDGYISSVNELQDALDALSSGEFDESDFVELVEKYPELAKNSDNLTEAIKAQIKELTGYESVVDDTGETVSDATGIMAVFEDAFGRVESEEDVAALQAVMDAVLELDEVVGSTAFSIDIEAETNGMENLWTAMKESVSSTSLTAESIANLKARYQDLENYDTTRLFEKTTNGIHLNTSALRELENAYESQKKAQIDSNLEDLVSRYNDLTEQINNASDAASSVDLYARRADIQAQIDDTAMLAAQYEGLTSAFYKWEQAQSIGEEGDMYDSLSGSLENIKELYDKGLIGTNKFRTAVQLMSNEDLSNASIDELLATYEAGYDKMTRYFQDSSDGCLNFLRDVQDLNSEWAHLNEDGSWDINFGLGNDQEIADALGINVESVQSILRKLSDYGFKINLDSEYSSFDLLSSKAEEANTKLKELGKTDYTFDFGTDDLDFLIDIQLPKAQELLDTFRNSDGNINMSLDGAVEAQTVLISLLSTKQALSAPEVMRIDTAMLNDTDEEIASAVSSFQEFIRLCNDLEIGTQLGIDTSETQQKLQTVATELRDIPDEIKTKLDFDDDALSEAIQNIINAEINVKAGIGINPDDIASVQNSIDNIKVEDIEITTKSPIMDVLETIEEYTIGDKVFSVIIKNNPLSLLDRINSYLFGDKSYKITAETVTPETPTAKSAPSRTMAWADGTAKADGDWSVPSTGDSLGGEIKPELVVRNGRWFTIGNDSVEFFHHKKGDIIFNGDQTEQIFKYGKIKRGKKRGKAFAEGTAFSNGEGSNKIIIGGNVQTRPSGSSSGESSGNSSNNDKNDSKIIDWIQIAINRIERAIDRLGTIATSPFRNLAAHLGATNDEISKKSSELSLQQKAYNRYMQQANSVGLPNELAVKVQNGAIDINEYDSDTAEQINDYQEWYEKALDCSDAISELNENIAELYQNKFDDVANDYENQLSLLGHLTTTYDNGISDLEERGYLATTKYYKALQEVEQQNITARKKELSDLTRAMSEAMNSGSIQNGSDAWYEFQQEINAVKEAIQESETALIGFNNSIRETEWGHFDYLQERISSITEEADFLINLMDRSDLYTDNGQLTNTGTATMGLHGQNYNVYMAQADKYAKEILSLNKEIAKDPYNTILLERREELLQAQRESILASEDEKQSIVDMVEQGIELELSALQELISTYTDALDNAKNLYDYQKKVKDQTSEIAKLQKQISAYTGDTSEENRAVVQKLQVSLSDAMENLEETQYEHYISEQKNLLGALYEEYEMVLNQRLDDVDALISDMVERINEGASSISDTIISESEKVGYTLSESIRSIWSNDGGALVTITQYGESFTTALTSVNNVLSSIAVNVGKMVNASDATANPTTTNTAMSTETNSSVKPQTNSQTATNSSTNKAPQQSASAASSRSDKDYYGVALAISNGGYGWGVGADRINKLRAKGFDANRVQSIVNKMFKDGYINNGTWKGRYQGITSLAPYHYNKYKHGGLVDYTGLAQLDGTPDEPEMVLNPEDTANFIALKDAMQRAANGDTPFTSLFDRGDVATDILGKLAKIDSPFGAKKTNIGNITYEVTIPIEHVSDYNDFMNQLRKDGKFERMIQSMTVDRLVGGSKLSKNRYQW